MIARPWIGYSSNGNSWFGSWLVSWLVSWRIARIGACALAICALFGFAGESRAACYGATQQLPAQAVNDFVANPSALLAQYPAGGPQLIARIRDLVASDPGSPPSTDDGVLNAVRTLFANASPEQKANIGSGMGQAARICIGVAQTLPPGPQQQAYQTYVGAVAGAAAGDDAVRVAYTAVAGDVALGGTGGGGGGGGAGGGGVGSGGLGTSSTPGSNSGTATGGGGGVNTLSFTYTPSTGGGTGAPSFTTSTTSSSPARSVSP